MRSIHALSRRGFLKAGVGATALLGLGMPQKLLADPLLNSDLHAQKIRALGTLVVVLVRHPDAKLAKAGIAAALREILQVHDKMTIFAPSPLQNLSERAQSSWAPIDDAQILTVLQQAHKVHKMSTGAFSPLSPVSKSRLAGLELDQAQARLRLADSRLDLNGIAKGYAVDQAKMALLAMGLQNFIVNAGGDLFAAGDASDAEPGWPVKLRAGAELKTYKILRLRDQASATSGNQGRGPLAGWGNTRHINDPRHRQHAAMSPLATCVISDSAMQADALATALFVAQRGLAPLLRQQQNTQGWIVTIKQHIEFIG